MNSFSLISNCAEGLNDSQIRTALEQSLTDVIDACKQMGAEPFLFADRAARSFLTISDWQQYDWLSHFLESEFSVQVELESSDA